jgi:hypothetical protein
MVFILVTDAPAAPRTLEALLRNASVDYPQHVAGLGMRTSAQPESNSDTLHHEMDTRYFGDSP